MADTTPKNFRMSPGAIALLSRIAARRGITETEVVEICVAKYAAELDQDIATAQEVFFAHVAGALSKRPAGFFEVAVGRDYLAPLDRLADKLNTTRGRLVEALINETQNRNWAETSPVAKRFAGAAGAGGDGAGAVSLVSPSERKASAVASDLLAAQVSASTPKREAAGPSARTSAPGAAGRASQGRKPSTPKPAPK